jgi:tetratricopeptide (TPR) repeat protein
LKLVRAAFVVVFALAPGANAEGHSPGVWERATDPEKAKADEVHRKVEALLFTTYSSRDDSGASQERFAEAMQLLERGHADKSSDVRLRFDFGHVAYLRHDEPRAAAVLESALREAPDQPLAMRAYFDLGVCYAKLGNTEAEIVAYDEYLRRQTDPESRALALANRAEAHMTLGREPHMTLARLAMAVNDYRSALLIDPGYPQAHWGLAVALDRNGDLPGALAEAKLAVTYDPLELQISGPNVFFVPAYEQYWYEALSAAARAQQLDDAPSSVLLWETSIAKWAGYVAVAASDDRWLPLARAHLASTQRRLDRAKKRSTQAAKNHQSKGDQEP